MADMSYSRVGDIDAFWYSKVVQYIKEFHGKIQVYT